MALKQLTREEVLAASEAQTEDQWGTGIYYNREPGQYCHLGWLLKAIGYPIEAYMDPSERGMMRHDYGFPSGVMTPVLGSYEAVVLVTAANDKDGLDAAKQAVRDVLAASQADAPEEE